VVFWYKNDIFETYSIINRVIICREGLKIECLSREIVLRATFEERVDCFIYLRCG
jgi:hypothetical protein